MLAAHTLVKQYDLILVNSSGGKDSQAMLHHVVGLCDATGVDRAKIVVVHADLGRVEWAGTRELAEKQAKHYDLRFIVTTRKQGDLLQQIEKRGMFPSNTTRYCTSDHKRSQVRRVMTALVRELDMSSRPARILNCMGLRAEESPARAKKEPFEHDAAASNGRRHVDTWLPIQHWTTAEVWQTIKLSGVPHHRAYDLGMKRLSCVFCIFAPRAALLLAGEHNRPLLDEYVRVEQKIGHAFQTTGSGKKLKLLPIASIRNALDAGERSTQAGDDGCWNM